MDMFLKRVTAPQEEPQAASSGGVTEEALSQQEMTAS